MRTPRVLYTPSAMPRVALRANQNARHAAPEYANADGYKTEKCLNRARHKEMKESDMSERVRARRGW